MFSVTGVFGGTAGQTPPALHAIGLASVGVTDAHNLLHRWPSLAEARKMLGWRYDGVPLGGRGTWRDRRPTNGVSDGFGGFDRDASR